MSTTAPIPGNLPEVTPTQPAPAPAQGSGASHTPPTQAAASADLRLVIEDDKAAGSYVYMTVDPRTGKVVSQIPREELLRMRERPDYKPGAVFDSRS